MSDTKSRNLHSSSISYKDIDGSLYVRLTAMRLMPTAAGAHFFLVLQFLSM